MLGIYVVPSMAANVCVPARTYVDPVMWAGQDQVIYCLDGARIGIQYETFFAGEPCEIYHCVLESKSFLEKMTVIQHTLPFFLPIREVETEHLSSNVKFIDHLEEILQSYIDRREQVRLIKELYGNQIGELFHSLPYTLIEFTLEDFECKVTVSIRYSDLILTLPSQARILAWPLRSAREYPQQTAVLNLYHLASPMPRMR
ncbi:hypothetical protein D1007_55905 [Hordeum vulgare]|nr:hypothetical protein D1007_55905 [Hordeum vulgare]